MFGCVIHMGYLCSENNVGEVWMGTWNVKVSKHRKYHENVEEKWGMIVTEVLDVDFIEVSLIIFLDVSTYIQVEGAEFSNSQ